TDDCCTVHRNGSFKWYVGSKAWVLCRDRPRQSPRLDQVFQDLTLVQFVGIALWKLVDDLEVLGYFPAGKLAVAVIEQFLHAGLCLRSERHHGYDGLAPGWMRHADHHGFVHRRMFGKCVLD